MASLTQNLILAEYAVKYVEAIMSKGPGPANRPESVVHRVLRDPDMPPVPKPLPGSEDATSWSGLKAWMSERMYGSPQEQWARNLQERQANKTKEIEKAVNVQRDLIKTSISNKADLDTEQKAILVGATVELSGLGNCGEQSRVAFKYLVTKGAPGLAIVNWGKISRLSNQENALSGNHTFVVIGMDPNVPNVTEASLVFPPKWGENAVVCDPWYHDWLKVTSVNDWQSRMKRILGETRNIAPDQPWLNRDVAHQRGKATEKEYAKSMADNWRFERQAFLPHGKPDLVKLACESGNQLRTLRQMGTANWR